MNLFKTINFHFFNNLFIHNFIVIFTVIVISVIGMGGCLSYYNAKRLNEEIMNNSIQQLEYTQNNIDNALYSVGILSMNFVKDEDVSDFIDMSESDTDNIAGMVDLVNRIKDSAHQQTLIRGVTYDISIYSIKGNYVISTASATDKIDIAISQEKKNSIIDNLRNHHSWYDFSNNDYVSYYQSLPFLKLDGERTGVIEISLKLDSAVFVNDKANIFVEYGKNIYQLYGEDYLGAIQENNIENGTSIITTQNGERIVISRLDSKHNGLSFVSAIPVSQVTSENAMMKRFIIVLVIIFLILAVFASYLVSRKMYAPVDELLNIIDNPAVFEDNEEIIDNIKWRESKTIIKYLKSFITKNKEMTSNLTEKIKLLREAQATALQIQITPHFIYNTLENINWSAIALTGGENDISRSISTLSKLMRISFDTKNDYVTVAEEQEYCNLYLQLQEYRYKDRFTVEWALDDDVMDCIISKFTLQPIIENAIQHGIKPLKKKGIIRIEGHITEGDLVLTVYDNGVGMSREKIQEISEMSSKIYSKDSKHIGIKNVNQRIKLVYDMKYGITIKSQKGIGTEVSITLPATKK